MQDRGMADVPVLTGPRVTLRAPRLVDADAIFERIASDPEVTRYLSWPTHPDVAETRRVITELFNSGGDDKSLLIELHDGGGPIGLCGWRRPNTYSAELGYCLGRRWWGQRIMSEVLPLLINEVQRIPEVYRMYAYCHIDNTGSARLLERGGLALEGRLVRYGMFPNLSTEPQDCLLFAKAVR
jgi:[ribosomal protein S5]-alanine N-acetyltransferase